ncbi:DUF2497 domain-containing protein [Sphingomonas sp. KR3-1]|uniref:DUF2497 domain-containing protein n=1 Tax=Sphingomonas sp. KR3-1 TaxID=3156611 RepID=UPI0032B46490
MGDISSEPSMEEILSSIKRIIAEEGDAAVATRARRGGRTATTVAEKSAAIDEILELSQPVDDNDRLETPTPMSMGSPTPPEAAKKAPAVAPATAAAPAEPIVSDSAAQATRGPLEALSRMVKPAEAPEAVHGTDTIEGLVRAMLKPMLSEWLDANLPRLVEDMVAKEISRITGRQ